MEGIVLGMCGFVFFNCSRMSPNVMPLVSYTCFGNSSALGLPVTSLVVVTCSPVDMPTPVLGLHTRIPTRVPFGGGGFQDWGYLSASTGFETTGLFVLSINISVIAKHIFFSRIFSTIF